MIRKTAIIISFLSFFMLFPFFPKVSAEDIQVKSEISKTDFKKIFDDVKDFSKRELIVKFKSTVTEQEKNSILHLINVEELSSVVKGDITLIEIPKKVDMETVAARLIQNKNVEFVEPNYRIEKAFIPMDPGFKQQWYLNKIQMSKAWDQSKGASNVTVAVLDGGVQVNHPDLSGKIVSPYNAVTGTTTFPATEHGTHVSGIIAATINSTGVAGIAPNIKLMPVNVFNGEFADMYDIANAIYYAVDRKADIINMSIGSRYYSYMLDYAVHYARSKGVLVVAAAGNEDTYLDTYPAAFETVIGVSATDSNDRITDFSNFGNYIDFSAPGLSIYSTVSGSTYAEMSGTSMAAPIVSGVASLILSKNPFLTPGQVEDILKRSSIDLGGKGWDSLYGYGRVDASRALQYTAYPVSNIALTYPNFSMTGTNKNAISINAQNGTNVSLFVQNLKGQNIKTLINNVKSTGTNLTAGWDGKQDNGLYVTSGSYRILAKVTNGKDTIYKTADLKVTDKLTPSVLLAPSGAFSPVLSGRASIPFEINKNAKITAILYDRNNKPVRSLLTNSSVSAGKRNLYWDWKNSRGQRMGDGTYRLVVSIIDHNRIKGANKQMVMTVDSTKPSGALTLNPNTFKMDGKGLSIIQLRSNENISMNAHIINERGMKIKTLTAAKWLKAGTSQISWDGKSDQNLFSEEGKYQYVLEYKDAAGNKSALKSNQFQLQDWRLPTIQAQANIEYRHPVNIPVAYSISKAGMVSVEIQQNGQSIRTIQLATNKAKGNHNFIWDGKDSEGKMLGDGNYQYQITLVDAYKQTASFSGNVNMALKRVDIQYPTVVPYHEWDDIVAEVYYKLSEEAKVTVEIRDNSNNKVRTILENQSLAEGIHSFNWDETDDEGDKTYESSYVYIIKAVNSIGNETVIQGKIINEDPSWLVNQEYSFIPFPDNDFYYQKLIVQMEVSQPIKVYLNIAHSYDQEPFESIEHQLQPGTNFISYEKTVTNLFYYELIYQDELGNKYPYEFDEYSY